MRSLASVLIMVTGLAACGGSPTDAPVDGAPAPDAPPVDAEVDECAQGTATCVPAADGGTCTDTAGAFTCGCAAGFDGDGNTGGTGCTDADECALGTATCTPAAEGGVCTNTPGAFTCGCAVGYTGDGSDGGTGCADVDECAAVTGLCGVDERASDCVNTVGGFRCEQTLGASPLQNVLFRLHRVTFAGLQSEGGALPNHDSSISAGPITGTITGVTSITAHPTTGEIWGLLKVSGVTGRVLGRLDPLRGRAGQLRTLSWTTVGNLGNNFATLAFLPDGSLFGATGDGAATDPESLFQIDPLTATATLVAPMGNGADGETLCFNSDDGKMYHWSGNGTAIMERFAFSNPPPATLTIEPISGGLGTGEIFGCEYLGRMTIAGTEEQVFRLETISSDTRFFTAAGVEVTAALGTFGRAPDDMRGIRAIPHALFVAQPAAGPVVGGTEVTLDGGALAGVTDVRFNGVPATIVDNGNQDYLVVTSPAATAPGPVVITAVLAGSGVTVAWHGFEYAASAMRTATTSRQAPAVGVAAPPTTNGSARRRARGKAH